MKIFYVQPFLIIQCDNFETPFATLIVDRKQISIGYVSYEKCAAMIIKTSYIFNLEFEKSTDAILNYISRFVMKITNSRVKSSTQKLYDYVNE